VKYQSTRGEAPILEFGDVLLAGLAEDGGLYVPLELPEIGRADLRAFADLPYTEVATRVLTPFVAPSIDEDSLGRMVEEAYASFRHPDVVPIKDLPAGGEIDHHIVELHWGPTFSFKDVALQLLGRLFEYELERRATSITIVGATSGDTGSAAIEACRDREGIELVMLHPRGRVSEVQRRQMTTIASANIHNVSIDGTFDDCQDLVKAMFAHSSFRQQYRLAAVNSINWARIAAQTVYYFTTGTQLGGGERKISFCVPTGNFGNVLAGYIAGQMGLPVDRLIIASNHNDMLTRTHLSGLMEIRQVIPSTSPAMDIQVSSNFERLLFDLSDRDSTWLRTAMQDFRGNGELPLRESLIAGLRSVFDAGRASESDVEETIADLHSATGQFVDPHTAVAVSVARRLEPGNSPIAIMSTAHPAKFGAVVEDATGVAPVQPEEIKDLFGRAERCADLPNELSAIMEFVSSVAIA